MTDTTYLFIGDSITECDRFEPGFRPLGRGYVKVIGDLVTKVDPSSRVINRGVSGNRTRDLVERWDRDCLDFSPDVVTIAVGINDTWRRYDADDATSASDFAALYERMLASLASRRIQAVVIVPFLLALSEEQASWREDLDPKIEIVHSLAAAHGSTLVEADALLNSLGDDIGIEALTDDGIHLSAIGHRTLAGYWWTSRGGSQESWAGLDD